VSLHTYVIERELPGAGRLSADELHTIATKSNAVLADMAPRVQWVQSYVTADKLYCIYRATDADAVREHACAGGFPANVVARVESFFDPTTGD
jgi:Nickel responsive protein SCO4226-like